MSQTGIATTIVVKCGYGNVGELISEALTETTNEHNKSLAQHYSGIDSRTYIDHSVCVDSLNQWVVSVIMITDKVTPR